MSKTIRMEEKDPNKITIPPLSIDEEGEEVIVDLNEAAGSEEKAPQEEVAESVDSTIKSILRRMNMMDYLCVVFICDGQSDSISINIVISVDRLVVYTTI